MTDITASTTTPRDAAIGRLKAKRAFTASIVSYLVANVVLWTIWALTGPNSGMPWPLWFTGFGALGLVVQAWSTFGQRPITESEIDREVARGS